MFVKIIFAVPVNKFYYYSVPDELIKEIEIGKRVEVDFNNRITYGYIIGKENKLRNNIKLNKLKKILDVKDPIPLFNKKNLELAQWISSYYFATLGEVLKIMTPGSFKVKPYQFDNEKSNKKKILLTENQQKIFNELLKLIPPQSALIYGITGSGKTEIYLSLIEEYIKKKSRLFTWYLKFLLPSS